MAVAGEASSLEIVRSILLWSSLSRLILWFCFFLLLLLLPLLVVGCWLLLVRPLLLRV